MEGHGWTEYSRFQQVFRLKMFLLIAMATRTLSTHVQGQALRLAVEFVGCLDNVWIPNVSVRKLPNRTCFLEIGLSFVNVVCSATNTEADFVL